MPRLFTALEIPRALRTRLSLMRAPLGGAKWVEPENMHITLRFAGDIDGRTADEFADQLAESSAEPFPVTIVGAGAFGGRDPRVLWAGVEAEPAARRALSRQRARRARGRPGARPARLQAACDAGAHARRAAAARWRDFWRSTAICAWSRSWSRASCCCRRGRDRAGRPTASRRSIRSTVRIRPIKRQNEPVAFGARRPWRVKLMTLATPH